MHSVADSPLPPRGAPLARSRSSSRRGALRLFAGAPVAPWLAPAGQAGKNRLWKTAVGLNGFESAARAGQGPYPIWDVLDFASRLGFDGVELVANWPMGPYPRAKETGRIRALRRLYDGFGLQIFAIQIAANGAFAPDAGTRANWLEDFEDRVALAKQLGCAHVGLWPGGGLGGQSLGEATMWLIDNLQRAAEIASRAGIVAAFEIEPPFLFNTEKQLMELLRGVNHPHMKTIYDPSHFDLMTGSQGKPHEMLKRVGLKNLGYVHLTDTDGQLNERGGTSRHLPVGDGHAEIATSLRMLREGGYRGWIMVDTYKTADPYDACVKAKRAMDQATR
jgi:sugar phosphate isomerase/epimerase